jgi:undecaprenyl-diphosphatase
MNGVVRRAWGGFAHPGGLAIASSIALAGSYAIAVRRPVPKWELRHTEWINGAPDAIADVLYPIMQLGTLAGPAIVAVGIAVFRRDWLLSGATMLAGLAAWFGAKGVKRVVERERPLGFITDIIIREGDGTGLGFVSGHSAVAATAAVMAMAALRGRWRLIPPVLAFLVGIARVVHGVHLTADIVGGWALGVLIGLGALGLVDLASPRPTTMEPAS